ncbi:hypothetical protein ET418_08280 [Oryzomonas rubra]|uniref:PBP domain-containing protein n=2 Tax=Oryzomonas rubra TaxID=2509454 RepID=A0A5A9XIR2_9BACT|nr:hypothetical protein ET418_08280 [Oryzomonas rubra]
MPSPVHCYPTQKGELSMKHISRLQSSILAAAMTFCLAQAALAQDVKLNGAASVVTDLVAPHQAAVEKATGYTLVVDKSNAGKGLIDLIDGKCDAAMASASLDATVKAAKSAGLTKAVPDLKMHVIAKSEVVFVVHPSNPVKSLTWEQIKDIHTGKIVNWKDVGGKDLPITVYTDAKASATRGLIKQVVMANGEYAASAKAVGFVKEVNDKVAVDASGIGGLGLGFVDPAQVTIVATKKIERPLGFITVGAPSTPMQKVMAAFKTASGN